MTPEELDRALWAIFKNREAELKDHMRTSWYTASLMRQQRLQPLHVWMGPPKPSAEEMARLKAEHEQMIKEFG
jgi:hypothetical protein